MADTEKKMFLVVICKNRSFLHFSGVILGELCCVALYFHYLNLELIHTFV